MGRKLNCLQWNNGMAKQRWNVSPAASRELNELTMRYKLSIARGDVILLEGCWYVTHTGLLGIARRGHCAGIHVQPVLAFCEPASNRWAFQATVYKSETCKGFVGFGDADPTNVSPLVHGAEMRVAETRAVNRALRKAYGIGICSVEEIGSLPGRDPKSPLVPSGHGNGFGGPKVRDRLCQLIRQHDLDPSLVKSYATDFCGVKALRDATREQVENFVQHLADWAAQDRNALLCQLNSYAPRSEGAA